MPDEHSNLNLPAAGRPSNRRRGRRGGRGRGRSPRPTPQPAEAPVPGEISPAPEAVEPAATSSGQTDHSEHVENEADSTGGFREPHPDAPAEFASHEPEPLEASESEPAALAPEPPRDRRPDRRSEPQQPRPWTKPAHFRPAEASAISQAVEHATEIAESLKQMIDLLDEVLELVEIAERQKLADEREIDELRRALRRIHPPRRELSHQQTPRGPRRDEPRRDQREQPQRREEPPVQPEPEAPAESPNPET